MPKTIVELLRPYFAATVRERGESYFNAGHVEVVHHSPTGVDAIVAGTRRYATNLAHRDGRWFVHCTCRAFQKLGPCKHLWALTLEVDARELALAFCRGGRAGRAGWRRRMDEIHASVPRDRVNPWEGLARDDHRLLYVVDPDETRGGRALALSLHTERRLKSGAWGQRRHFDPASAARRGGELPRADRDLLAAIATTEPAGRYPAYARPRWPLWVAFERLDELLPRFCATGRFFLEGEHQPLVFDDREPWAFGLRLARHEARGECVLSGFLARGAERMNLGEPALLIATGFLFTARAVSRLDVREAAAWIDLECRRGPLRLPLGDEAALIEEIAKSPGRPLLDLPGLPPARTGAPKPHLHVHRADGPRRRLACEISFSYAGVKLRAGDPCGLVRGAGGEGFLYRDREAERAALARFLERGGRRNEPGHDHDGRTTARDLPRLVHGLLADGWSVEADGRVYRQPGTLHISVRSGVDWFDLEGGVDFDGEVAPLPALLAAARAGSRTVQLGDGSVGLLPERWLEQWGLLDALAKRDGDRLRFSGNQGWLLDALLAAHDGVDVDARFAALREKLNAFSGVRPGREPRGFCGTLRGYQRDGLGWFGFLRDLGLGGCLADDMGLGKTVQVLAMLEARRRRRRGPRCSLVVAPKSLVFNWIEEARRFAPQLEVVDYTGLARKARRDELERCHLAVTTYGTLRRDIVELKERRFDYAILDEAQAIKNPRSQAAKAARLLQADHRLALTGTPVENHLGDLWSIFEFLNPGMLGRASAFQSLTLDSGPVDEEARAALAAALRPFLLRRKKEQVLPDLPAKTEQTIYCEMGHRQREEYGRLRDHYRAALLARGREKENGLGTMKIQVLEALLRLRQAACHPGLVDPARAEDPAAKLDVLMAHLEEVCAADHKALVFSQFTKLLAIVRRELDRRGIAYEYLDGRTRNRQEKVTRFQTTPAAACPLFLVSLKAGGAGLNLTAADYVFLLDPWWNPAVESQAIDRTHRIGQTRKVAAYRLICRDTVEEKVLELQAGKRALADAIIRADRSVLRQLTRADLERLLS